MKPPTVTIVWACRLDMEGYGAAGREVWVPRPSCPSCGRPMVFWSGYWRYVRGSPGRIWVRRAKCMECAVSHALLPSFVLVGRLDEVAVIGRGVVAGVSGRGMRWVATELRVPHETARGWWRRYRARAPTLTAGYAAFAIGLGAPVPELRGSPEEAALEVLGAAWWRARQRFGEAVSAVFEFASVVSGGELLGTTTSPPWARLGGATLMPPVPVQPS
jgi:Domain of unknown function (DUF6431)